MDSRAKLSLALIVVALGVGAVVASGFGSDASRKPAAAAAPSASAGPSLADVASPAELKLWNDRGCVTCHGAGARGTQMGPDLVKVLPLYLAKYGTPEAAKNALAAYLVDPKRSPKLRDDGMQFVNPMPPIEKLFGGKPADADALAGMLLRLVE